MQKENHEWIASTYLYIPVTDVNRAGEWYSENLGFQWNDDPKHNRELKTDSGVWVFLQPDAEYQRAPDKVAFGFMVPQIRELHSVLRERGLLVTELVDNFGLTFRVSDPDGNVIELWGGWSNS